jgi:hypothetical protein
MQQSTLLTVDVKFKSIGRRHIPVEQMHRQKSFLSHLRQIAPATESLSPVPRNWTQPCAADRRHYLSVTLLKHSHLLPPNAKLLLPLTINKVPKSRLNVLHY